MTPLAIEIMLQCYCSSEPWGNMQPQIWNSSAAQEARDALVRDGLLYAETLRATQRGRDYVAALCATRPNGAPKLSEELKEMASVFERWIAFNTEGQTRKRVGDSRRHIRNGASYLADPWAAKAVHPYIASGSCTGETERDLRSISNGEDRRGFARRTRVAADLREGPQGQSRG